MEESKKTTYAGQQLKETFISVKNVGKNFGKKMDETAEKDKASPFSVGWSVIKKVGAFFGALALFFFIYMGRGAEKIDSKIKEKKEKDKELKKKSEELEKKIAVDEDKAREVEKKIEEKENEFNAMVEETKQEEKKFDEAVQKIEEEKNETDANIEWVKQKFGGSVTKSNNALT